MGVISIMSKVGKILKLQHAQKLVKGVASLRKTKPVYVTIGLEYDNGNVNAVGSNDTWEVVPSKDSRASFETV